MMTSVAAAVPGCRLAVCANGFYAFLAAQLPPAIPFTSRLRRDAVLHDELGYRAPGTRGRKPTKGPKLPKPSALADEAGRLHLFSRTTMTRRQQQVERLVYARRVWGTASGGRWSIELAFRETKQLLGSQEPQSWAGWGLEQTTAFAYGLDTLIWTYFLLASPAEQQQALRPWPWYPQQTISSFADARACLRRQLWQRRFSARAGAPSALEINAADVEVLIDHASRAA